MKINDYVEDERFYHLANCLALGTILMAPRLKRRLEGLQTLSTGKKAIDVSETLICNAILETSHVPPKRS